MQYFVSYCCIKNKSQFSPVHCEISVQEDQTEIAQPSLKPKLGKPYYHTHSPLAPAKTRNWQFEAQVITKPLHKLVSKFVCT